MNYFNRACANIKRGKTRTFLLGAVFFLIGNFIIIGLTVYEAAENTKILTQRSFAPVVELEINYIKQSDYVKEFESQEERNDFYGSTLSSIQPSDIQTMVEDSRVKAVNYFFMTQNIAEDVAPVLFPVDDENKKVNLPYMDEFFLMIGTYYPNIVEFYDGTHELINGRNISQEDIDQENSVIVISKEVAQLNQLSVGDEITFSGVIPSLSEELKLQGIDISSFYYRYEIIGIYKTTLPNPDISDPGITGAASESPLNAIYVPFTTLTRNALETYLVRMQDELKRDPSIQLPTRESYLVEGSVTFLLNDSREITQFIEDYKQQKTEFIELNTDYESYKKMIEPFDSLILIAKSILGIVIINAIGIMTLVTMISLKSRRHEIGVLYSMGVSKKKIVLQFLVEWLIITGTSFTLAILSGSFLASSIGHQMLNQQLIANPEVVEVDESQPWTGERTYFTELSRDEVVEYYHISIRLPLIIEIYEVCLIVVFISITLPTLALLRFNPKKIIE